MASPPTALVIACGALAREIVALRTANGWSHLDVRCLPAELHNTPQRIPGAHCYEFFAGADAFAALADDEPGTFYVTDFLLRHFDRLVIRGLGLDRHPELADRYFGNYRRLVYLAQTDDPTLTGIAGRGARRLGLAFERRLVGLGELGPAIAAFAATSAARPGTTAAA